jgi:hypothetical protein
METVNQEATTTQENAGEETKTFTQAELDKIVGDRLSRERSKYADYESLKEKAARLDEMEEANKSELQKAMEQAESYKKELDALKSAEAIRNIREQVSKDTGIPMNLLTGTTEEDCKAQAEAIKAFATPTYPTVKDGGEMQNATGQSNSQQFADWFAQNANIH